MNAITYEILGTSIRLDHSTVAVLETVGEPAEILTEDVARLRSGVSEEALLEHCLDGAEGDEQIAAWRDYVSAVVAAVGIDPDAQCTEHGCARHRCDADHEVAS